MRLEFGHRLKAHHDVEHQNEEFQESVVSRLWEKLLCHDQFSFIDAMTFPFRAIMTTYQRTTLSYSANDFTSWRVPG
jgi:hypothetical protein